MNQGRFTNTPVSICKEIAVTLSLRCNPVVFAYKQQKQQPGHEGMWEVLRNDSL